MAAHLVKAGHDVTVWNRTPSKAAPLREAGATVADAIEDVPEGADIVFTCVSRNEDVFGVVAAMMGHARQGALFVDHSTTSPGTAREVQADLAERGIRFMDAPVTGGSMGAQAGTLTVFCGGRQEDFDRAATVIAAYAKRAELVGPVGAGQTMKVANQIAVGGALLGLCESLAFAKKAGLDLAVTRELLAGGAAGSWAFDNYGPKILAGDWSPGFSVKNQRKDFAYAFDAAKEKGAAVPGTVLVDFLLSKLTEQGLDDRTTAALFDVILGLESESWT